MLDLMNKMTQLSEAKEKTKTGLKHTAEPGGYGRKDDEDDEGHKVKADAVKKGKGRPKKDADDSGETKKYDFSAFGVKSGKDVKLPKHDKKKTTVIKGKSQSHADNKKDDGTDPEGDKTKAKKKSLKEYFDLLDKAIMNEDGITVKPMPGASQIIGPDGKPMGTADATTANMMKQASEKGMLKIGGEDEMKEGTVSDHPENQTKIQKQFSSIPGLMDVWKKYKHLGDYGTNLQTTMAAVKKEFPRMDPKTLQSISTSLIDDNDPYSSNSIDAAFYAAKEIQKYLAGAQQVNEKDIGKHNNATTGFDALVRKLTPKYGEKAAKRIAGSQLKKIGEADQPPNDSLMSPMSEARAKADDKAEKAGKKVVKDIEYDEGHKGKDDNKAEKAGKKVTKDIEYDEKKKCPPMSHIKKMCQDGKSVAEICKMHPDCDQKELKQMVADCKKTLDEASMPMKKVNGKSVPAFAADGKGKNDLTKKKVKEGMEHKLKAARHTGKAHALSKQGYNCGYDDMEESRHYHEGYKEGLDECYGQMPMGEGAGLGAVGAGLGALAGGPIGAVIGGGLGGAMEEGADSTVDDMASFGAHTPEIADEGNAFTDKLRKTPDGGTFRMGRNTYTDRSSIEESPFAFEAWEKELNAILEGKEVTEGMTVSISKGQQGSPDSVSVSAQDGEADQLLNIIKQAGLGLFGGDDAGHPQATPPMTVDVDGGEGPQANIEVVDDHDDMLSLIRKMTGQGPAQSNGDYEEEGGEEMHGHNHGEEETCESCGGMMEEGHSCGEEVAEDELDDGEAVEENQTIPQAEEEVAEDAAQDDGQAETTADENAEAAEDQALATVDAAQNESDEELEESLANGADDTFESDIDFMTKVITGGINKEKIDVAGNGQSTIPAVATTRESRLGNPMRESTDLLHDWRKLSGIN
jgi:hypothetical protein